jgi:rhamnulokinase
LPDSLYIAIDLGAGSGRVFLGGMGPGELLLEEVRRFHYPPRRLGGHLRWDFGRIVGEIHEGLQSAAATARELRRRVHSIGVDSWGVDYGLTDAGGVLLEDPICYRDERTVGAMDAAFHRVPRAEIFRRTGIQFLPINTLFQLVAHAAEGLPDRAAHLVLMPDLINAMLTGRGVTEYTNATTTQMVSAETGDWDGELVGQLGLPRHLLCPIVPTGTVVGPLLPHIASVTGLEGVVVIAPATHDTGSAVAGTPLQDEWAYISSGTWSLVGVEREGVLVDETVARHNFTNEGGAFDTVRLLKNSMGLWILESCRQEWRASGVDVDYALLLERAAATRAFCGLIFPDDPRFLNPPSMLAAVNAQMRETGQSVVSEPAAVTRVVLDSLALRYGSILRMIASITGRAVRGVQIVGGGSRNAYLNQATATVTGLPVVAGPVEATVIGNVLIQAMAAGRFASLAAARRHVAANIESTSFEPRPSEAWETARRLYAEIEGRFVEGQ